MANSLQDALSKLVVRDEDGVEVWSATRRRPDSQPGDDDYNWAFDSALKDHAKACLADIKHHKEIWAVSVEAVLYGTNAKRPKNLDDAKSLVSAACRAALNGKAAPF